MCKNNPPQTKWRQTFDALATEYKRLQDLEIKDELERVEKLQNLPKVKSYQSGKIDVRYFIRIRDMHLSPLEKQKLVGIGVHYVGDILHLWIRIETRDFRLLETLKRELEDMHIFFNSFPKPMANWRPADVRELSEKFFPEGLPVDEVLCEYL